MGSTSPDPAQLARQTWCNLTIMILFVAFLAVASASDLNRQSIIFNENTPDVFYCPQEKPISIDRMLVKSRPMKKLCEHEGRAIPKGSKSDCWNDVDETEYACTAGRVQDPSNRRPRPLKNPLGLHKPIETH